MLPSSASIPQSMRRIGVGIDTSRYGHYACFLRDDLQPAAAEPPTWIRSQRSAIRSQEPAPIAETVTVDCHSTARPRASSVRQSRLEKRSPRPGVP